MEDGAVRGHPLQDPAGIVSPAGERARILSSRAAHPAAARHAKRPRNGVHLAIALIRAGQRARLDAARRQPRPSGEVQDGVP
jgi:hypothetical protein